MNHGTPASGSCLRDCEHRYTVFLGVIVGALAAAEAAARAVAAAALHHSLRAATPHSQRCRKRGEEPFGWMKTIGLLRQLRHPGGTLINWIFTFHRWGV